MDSVVRYVLEKLSYKTKTRGKSQSDKTRARVGVPHCHTVTGHASCSVVTSQRVCSTEHSRLAAGTCRLTSARLQLGFGWISGEDRREREG